MEAKFICKDCGFMGGTKKIIKGSILVELFLWLLFLLPGIIYSIWRGNTRKKVCAKCGNSNIVPVDSPVGIDLANKYYPKA